ncbi:hypothetical protein EYV94_06475 [Puteibacter caeruleilacunae]|nr:hypothetical protein EYV94_06475 [Puteibacter caeruleilacunae]
MKRLLTLFLVVTSISCFNCLAQDGEEEIITDWSKELFIQEVTQQYLEPLNLQLDQHTECRNKLFLLQHGNKNTISIKQYNSGNEMVAIQDGDENEILTNMHGPQIENYVVQDGYKNRAKQDLSGSLMHAIFQQGSFHEVTVNENGNHYPKLMITQKGVGMKLIINNGSIEHP